MNRKQRRANKSVAKDPAFMVKKSEMTSHIGGLLKHDDGVQKAIQEEVHRVELLEAKKQAEDIDTLILMTLHKVFGFGRVRLLRFAANLNDIHKYYEDLYEDCDMFAMKKHLKEWVGIDVTKLEEEIVNATEESSTKG